MSPYRSLTFALILCGLTSFAALAPADVPRTPVAQAPAAAASVTVPFELDLNKIVVPVKVNGHGPFQFVLDTGASSAFFLNGDAAAKMGLESVGEALLQGAGGDHKGQAVSIADGVAFTIGDLELRGNQMAYAAPGSEPLGKVDWDGIFGRQVFDQRVVEIDWVREELRFHDPETYEPPAVAAVVPLELRGGHPLIEARVELPGRKPQTVRMVVDTGDYHALSLARGETVPLPPKHITDAVLGRGLNGKIHGAYGRIPALDLGGHRLENLIVSFPDRELLPILTSNSGGNLGSEVLRRFTVAFDYPGRRMILLPNRHAGEPFAFSTSGFRPFRVGPDEIRVDDVYAGSPAARAGIAVGDRLLKVAGRPAADLAREDLISLLRQPPGTELPLLVERDGKRREVVLRLEKIL